MPTVSLELRNNEIRPPFVGVCVQKKDARKGGKSKKTQLRFSINCATPVEDEIMDAGAFVSLGFLSADEVLCGYRVRVPFPSPYPLPPPPLPPSLPPSSASLPPSLIHRRSF